MNHELWVALERGEGAPQTGGAARLTAASDRRELPGSESAAGFRFTDLRSGRHALRYEVTPGATYAWHVDVNVAASELQVVPATSVHSTDVMHTCVVRAGRGVYQATVRADLARYWDGRARELIGFARGQQPPTFAAMNRRITAAYARMYLSNPQVFKWAGMAAFASKAVGDGMGQAGALAESGLPIPPIPGVDATWVSGTEIKGWLATGNMVVYADIFWQHLAFRESGIEMIVHEENEGRLERAPREGWESIARGIREKDDGLIWQGNRELLRFEQLRTLQATVYDKNRWLWRVLSEKPVTTFQRFTSPIPGDPTPFSGTDFGDPEQRWRWIDNSMLPAWRRLEGDRPRACALLEPLAAG